MTRILFAGGRVFDGTGALPAQSDVVVADSLVVDVGPGLDGDEAVDCAGMTLLPGLFDCHVHVVFSGALGVLDRMQQPFSYQLYEAATDLVLPPASGCMRQVRA